MSYKLESDVIKALGELLENKFNCDVIIHVGEKPNFKEYHAHSNILSCRSKYFNEILSTEDIKKKDGKYIITKQNITPQAFDVILKYLYTGHININNKTGTELLDIMIASDELKLEQLTKLTEEFIVKNYQQFLQNDPVGIIQIVYYNKSFFNLQEFCLETICYEPKILFNNNKFINLPAPLLEIILKRDDLNLTEIEIWDNLIKWGLTQGQTLNKDISKWNQDDFNQLQRILYKFIPLIRFYLISSDDYFNKVKPYEDILSKELKNDILKFHMVSEYRSTVKILPRSSVKCNFNIDSVTINQIQNHFAIFANWIDKRGENNKYTKDIPYKFNLLYRVSRDGNTAEAFHENCDNKGATIVIIKIEGSEQIIGGYNPIDWNKDGGYKSTTDSFIFSFTDRRNTKTAKVGYSNGKLSICGSTNFGPIFGDNLYCRNDGNTWNINNVYHSNIDGLPNGSIKVDDYEVFQVVK
ncbi:BTB/POZ domain-containing protein [Rhizophagus irregularis DAOM 181602=DAOM 197198]|uniref:Uncharacterized protein n=2 Tax=Rhizophagus irregularis TaxID=588596 RepID=U9U5W8_RHIID|nr:hypothetical protein GLOIN_2v1845149 [Rhizophagus irregularis DAOM 181602=DAOM 197198]EXX58737.1 hypothetical protein RirG_195260 [Rhizophagus irregularis DAOM 197198w]POG64747.1 hypothetical protein GLOIN_2v1845149 [Rhizophagus irregularis DAOM 181602=DAOM 197198]GBC17514.1 BTB/POZ domain-containing protein [Rhizophagus irregularis DAOM 181602=DAOM 197198]|eukprot:XP_025171613.1 hypothetical protein GLOIN_2v1845149 [Rhizophagus irregularis DAOM 181602=DAOM 197198]